MIANICDNILDIKKWIAIKFIFGISVMLLFGAFFIHEYEGEKSEHYFKNAKDLGTFIRNVEFFVPAVYAVATKNPIMLSSYAFVGLSEAIFIKIVKYCIKEERPDHSNNRSFPSGHSAMVFFVAHFIFLRIKKIYSLPFYCIGFFVAGTRLYYNKHWPIDVLAGFLISVFFVHYIQRISCYFAYLIKTYVRI